MSEATSEITVPNNVSKPENPLSLRWWPAALLLVIMIVLRTVPWLLELQSPPVMMVSFMGPALITLLIFAWWLLFSRATWRDKLLTFGGVLLMLIIGLTTLHFSLKGMFAFVYIFPMVGAIFALMLIIGARWFPEFRRRIVLLSTMLVLIGWNLLQSEGVTGTFNAQFKPRWSRTAEDIYLASRGPQTTPTKLEKPTVSADKEAVELNAEWPLFRGPNLDNRIPGIIIAETWDKQPPRELWRKRIGPGWSSFTVAGSQLFTQEQRGENEAVVCLDAATGAEIWSYAYPARFWEAIAGAGPRATPTLAEGAVFAFGADGMLVRLDPRTGQRVWQQNVKRDAAVETPMWGFASSPLVTQGVVIVHAGGKGETGIMAYDAATGKLRWSIASGDHSYSTAQVATLHGTTGVLMLSNAGLQFLDPESGKLIWEYKSPFLQYRALQPLVRNNAILFATPGGDGTRRIEVEMHDEKWQVREVWVSRDMKSDFNDFVELNGFIYGFDGNIFACVDTATGKSRWKKGRYGKGQVLALPAADQLLVLTEQGEIVLIKATSEKLDERARFKCIEGKTWNHPVLIGNKLYLRNAEEAACFELPLVNST